MVVRTHSRRRLATTVTALLVAILVGIVAWRAWIVLKPLGPGFYVQFPATAFGRDYMEADDYEAGLLAMRQQIRETKGWSYAVVPCEEAGHRRVVATLELSRPLNDDPVVPFGRVRVTAHEVAPLTGLLFTDGHSDWFPDSSVSEDIPDFPEQEVVTRLCIVAWRE